MKFLLSELADQLDGSLSGPDVTVDGVTTDSRSIKAGQLFVPLVAERDGHDYIDGAVAAGCGAYLTAQPPVSGSAIAVADTAEALTEIGRVARRRLAPHVVGVTGSVGKTTVKDMIRSACASSVETFANTGSFNNEIGLPLTLANAPESTAVTVTEMGARGLGHIAELCEIAAPTIGVVTAVALVHSELFGSIDAVTQTKGELVEALPESGTAILNADDPHVSSMRNRTNATVVSYGQHGDIKPVDIHFDELLRPRFTVVTPEGEAAVSLNVSGAHMVGNGCAAIAVALAAGVRLDAAAAGLGDVSMSRWRMEMATSSRGLLVINDAYNANPTSMRAALATLGEVDATHKVAMLGVMGELGVEGSQEHLNIAAEAKAAGITVVAVDALEYGPDVTHVASIDEAVARLGDAGEDHAVLVKASRSAGLERLADKLVADKLVADDE